jgi:hypothetical protein
MKFRFNCRNSCCYATLVKNFKKNHSNFVSTPIYDKVGKQNMKHNYMFLLTIALPQLIHSSTPLSMGLHTKCGTINEREDTVINFSPRLGAPFFSHEDGIYTPASITQTHFFDAHYVAEIPKNSQKKYRLRSPHNLGSWQLKEVPADDESMGTDSSWPAKTNMPSAALWADQIKKMFFIDLFKELSEKIKLSEVVLKTIKRGTINLDTLTFDKDESTKCYTVRLQDKPTISLSLNSQSTVSIFEQETDKKQAKLLYEYEASTSTGSWLAFKIKSAYDKKQKYEKNNTFYLKAPTEFKHRGKRYTSDDIHKIKLCKELPQLPGLITQEDPTSDTSEYYIAYINSKFHKTRQYRLKCPKSGWPSRCEITEILLDQEQILAVQQLSYIDWISSLNRAYQKLNSLGNSK